MVPLLASLLAIPPAAAVPAWEAIDAPGGFVQTFVDANGIAREGDVVRFRVRGLFERTMATGMRAMIAHWQVDCAARNGRMTRLETYGEDDRQLSARDLSVEEEPVQPIGDRPEDAAMLRRICETPAR
ncbi:hypothetical protein RCO27_16470 [Sphingosinicella sp. LHD-64]|uniref:surface-adhesin E family protein n=1 Tax=Sphingosinicella sp. LHD-64 TaxID=3072139 RepID=UPI00280D8460|nr:surface-adhesin E family protein [Sphingosinicella sp. LHD-64]MDQ8757822.1 hypothetical protein [Sphingosinicella sp. LHD-64]